MTSALALPAQPVDATQALNLSAGVSNCKVSRGRSFSGRATLFRWACECTDKSVPLGKYSRSSPAAAKRCAEGAGLEGAPADRAGARVDCFPAHTAFPKWQEGRHPHCHFRGLLRLSR